MIKAKQSEREAKRLEGDIKKEQRQLQHSLRNLDVGQSKNLLIYCLLFKFSIKFRYNKKTF